MNDLSHGYKVDVIVGLENFIHPVKEGIEVLRIVLQPSGMEEKAKRSSVLVIMTIKVVGEEVVELVTAQDFRAGI